MKSTWTPRRIVGLIVIGPVTAIAFGVAVQVVNPGWMVNASYGGQQVVDAPAHISPLPEGR